MKPLGSPVSVTIRKVVRTQYRVDWEYDGFGFRWDQDTGAEYPPQRKKKVRFVNRKSDAYRIAALRLIFAKRDRYATGRDDKGRPVDCLLCDERPREYEYEERQPCRYHGGDAFESLRDRLARWLMWRDQAIEGGEHVAHGR